MLPVIILTSTRYTTELINKVVRWRPLTIYFTLLAVRRVLNMEMCNLHREPGSFPLVQ